MLARTNPGNQTLLHLGPSGLAVSIVTYGELYQDAFYAYDRKTAIRGLRQFLQGKRLLGLTKTVVERFGVVRAAFPAAIKPRSVIWTF